MVSVTIQSCLDVKILLYLFISACLLSALLFFYWRGNHRDDLRKEEFNGAVVSECWSP